MNKLRLLQIGTADINGKKITEWQNKSINYSRLIYTVSDIS